MSCPKSEFALAVDSLLAARLAASLTDAKFLSILVKLLMDHRLGRMLKRTESLRHVWLLGGCRRTADCEPKSLHDL